MTINRLSWDNRVGRGIATYGGLDGRASNGYVVPILSRTDFSLDTRNTSSAIGNVVPLAVGVDSSTWVSGALLVRIHARSTWTGMTATIAVENIMLVPEEPDVVFASSTPVATTTDLGAVSIVPSLLVVAFTPPIGPLLRVRLTTIGTTTATNTISLGVDLVGRPA